MTEKSPASATPKSPGEVQKEWENLKNLIQIKPQDTAYAIRTARQLGVDAAEIRAVAQEAVDRELNKYNNAPMAFSIMKAAELGTPEERRAIGERAYQDHMSAQSGAGAQLLAVELWGEGSPQHVAAQELMRCKQEQFEKEQAKQPPLMRLSEGATLDQFSTAYRRMVEREGMGIDIEIEADMKVVFGEDVTKQVLSFLKGEDSALGSQKLVEYFKQHGFGQDKLEEVFGIQFTKSRSKR